MYFEPSADIDEIPKFLTRFKTIANWSALKRRFDEIDSNKGTIFSGYYYERLGLENSLNKVFKYNRATNRFPDVENHYINRAYSFATTLVRVHENLSESGKKRLEGTITDFLTKDHGLAPLAFELKTAVNLMQAGFDVSFTDLEGLEKYDLLAVKNGVSVEVECKFLSADIGRKIHQRELCNFAEKLNKSLKIITRDTQSKKLIHIKIDDRLTKNDEENKEIIDAIAQNLFSKESITFQEFQIDFYDLGDKELSFLFQNDDLKSNFSKLLNIKLGTESPHAFLTSFKHGGLIATCIESKKDDTVLETIKKKLKSDAKSQLSKSKPAFVFCHFADITEKEIEELARAQKHKNVGLQIVANQILDKRPHIHTIGFSADGTINTEITHNSNVAIKHHREVTKIWSFVNDKHQLSNQPELLFLDK